MVDVDLADFLATMKRAATIAPANSSAVAIIVQRALARRCLRTWNFFGIWYLEFEVSLELLTSEVLLTKEVGSWSLALPATATL